MFQKVHSMGIMGIEGYGVVIEADVSDGLPCFIMAGNLAPQVREAGDRVRTALKNSGFRLPAKKITINLSPADVRKEGTAYDLPIAVAVLAASGIVEPDILKKCVIVGELGLDGSVKPVPGILSIVSAAKKDGKKLCFLPEENEVEGRIEKEIKVAAVACLKQLTELLNNPSLMEREDSHSIFIKEEETAYDVDFSEISGQLLLRRATEVAVAGFHNILYIGAAGTGKTMTARRIPTIMPELSIEESIELSKVYSVCGMLPQDHPLLFTRPFRSPHHTISPQTMVGGGRIPKPGEVSLASKGVLFLDELPEFKKSTIETLRQPLEEGKITISRVYGSYEYPADFMLAAAMNPCNCGFYPDRSRCNCSRSQVKQYLKQISKPLLDRIDICVEAAPVSYEELKQKGKGEGSAAIRRRVEQAWQMQRQRLLGRGIYFNSAMRGREIAEYCGLGPREQMFMTTVFSRMGFSARGYDKILKVARTVADLDESREIRQKHLAEAVSYRSLEEKYWKGVNEWE